MNNVEVKHPFAHLGKNGDSVVFFEIDGQDSHYPIASWDDISTNYPRWCLARHSTKEAIERVTEMVKNEDWELYETSEDELVSLVE